MIRLRLALATACTTGLAATLLVPSLARAAEVEIGRTATALSAPTCPASLPQTDCKIVLPEVTALETLSDGTGSPARVSVAGELDAFTLGISDISSSASTLKTDLSYLDSTYGGAPEAQITVLRPVGKRGDEGWQVAAQSAPVALRNYLGRVVQFPLAAALPVVPGEQVALTVPTWAPVLSFGLSKTQFAYRQSRRSSCGSAPSTLVAELSVGDRTRYACNYPGTRVEYTATEVTSPAANGS